MKKWEMVVGVMLIVFVGWWLIGRNDGGEIVSPLGENIEQEKPYDKYSFERLVERKDGVSEIEVKDGVFSYMTEGKKVTGAITIPEGFHYGGQAGLVGGWPVVVMVRGYVDKEIYTTGMGTSSAAKYYASRGYVTLAPDFLGFGGSDEADEDSMGARLVKPVAVLDLLASLKSLEYLDLDRVYLWGHSNGGQIALSVVEILGRREQLSLRARPLRV